MIYHSLDGLCERPVLKTRSILINFHITLEEHLGHSHYAK